MNKHIPIVLIIFIFLTGCSGNLPKLGINNGQLMQCPETPNCVNSQALDEKHFIQPIHFIGTQQEARTLLLEILKAWKRVKITVTQENYIRAEFTSTVFRFVDDVEFYFPVTQTKEIIIHIRSASRVGHSDFGANRKRIEQIRTKLKLNHQ
jgi:uncharacterized protein (DUF1499 family)